MNRVPWELCKSRVACVSPVFVLDLLILKHMIQLFAHSDNKHTQISAQCCSSPVLCVLSAGSQLSEQEMPHKMVMSSKVSSDHSQIATEGASRGRGSVFYF